jgi:hypothetical protein
VSRLPSAFAPAPPDVPPRPDQPPAPFVAPRRRWVSIVAVLASLAVVSGVAASAFVSGANQRPAGDPSDYRFLASAIDGGPVRWNPCAPIRFVVNDNQAPPGSLQTVREAVERVSTATGIEFFSSGSSNEIPTLERDPIEFTGTIAEWSPVLIAWVTPGQTDIGFTSGERTAVAVSAPLAPRGEDVYVTGWIAINAQAGRPPGFDGSASAGPILLHELGHLVGLGHVRAPGEIMEPTGGDMTDYGVGDLEGLRRLGHEAGCLQTPSAAGRS